MFRMKLPKSLFSLALGVALGLLPLQLQLSSTGVFSFNETLAKGKGGEKGNKGNNGNHGGGNQGNGNQGNGNQGNGNQGSGNQGAGNQGNGNQGAGNQGNGNQGNGNQANDESVAGLDQNSENTTVGKNGKIKSNKGSISSKLGALNAAHASPQALANAAPNSRVGRIEIYRQLALATQGVNDAHQVALAEAETAKDAAEIAQQDADTAATDAGLAQVAADQALQDSQADPTVVALADLAKSLQDEADKLQIEADDLQTLANDLKLEAESKQQLADQKAVELDDAKQSQLQALAAAANKPVTPEVEEEVNSLLGIETTSAANGLADGTQ